LPVLVTVMKRSWNWVLWAGFAVALLATFSYIPVFVNYPLTRDFPWANLLLFVAAGGLLFAGLRRAFGQPDRYRGKIGGSIVAALSLLLCGLFAFGTFYAARSLPSGRTAPRVGQMAPDFQLADTAGNAVTLAGLRQGKRAVLLIFYRGYW
jgi:hypothetical protein